MAPRVKEVPFDVYPSCYRTEEREFKNGPRGLLPHLGRCPLCPGPGLHFFLIKPGGWLWDPQAPLGSNTIRRSSCFHYLVQQKARAEINTLNYVFAELRPEEIEKQFSQRGTGFTVGPLETPFRGSVLGSLQTSHGAVASSGLIKRHFTWKAPESHPRGGKSQVRSGGRAANVVKACRIVSFGGAFWSECRCSLVTFSPRSLFLSGRRWSLQAPAF